MAAVEAVAAMACAFTPTERRASWSPRAWPGWAILQEGGTRQRQPISPHAHSLATMRASGKCVSAGSKFHQPCLRQPNPRNSWIACI